MNVKYDCCVLSTANMYHCQSNSSGGRTQVLQSRLRAVRVDMRQVSLDNHFLCNMHLLSWYATYQFSYASLVPQGVQKTSFEFRYAPLFFVYQKYLYILHESVLENSSSSFYFAFTFSLSFSFSSLFTCSFTPSFCFSSPSPSLSLHTILLHIFLLLCSSFVVFSSSSSVVFSSYSFCSASPTQLYFPPIRLILLLLFVAFSSYYFFYFVHPPLHVPFILLLLFRRILFLLLFFCCILLLFL